jgi:dihydrofolate reductase/thymidylate synthase
MSIEEQYLKLLNKILLNGDYRNTRNSETYSLFCEHLKLDLREGFPLLTTKKMFIRGIIEELLFFLRGETDSKILEDKNVNIWKGNTSRYFLDSLNMNNRKEGLMGPMYGYQWRFFNAKYNEENGKNLENGIDQLENVINLINNDPYSRRILLTSYNPCQSDKGVLYPCHSVICQFYCDSNNNLDMFCYNRSQDIFHGVPFNIASSSLLLMIIANITNRNPRYLNISMGDVHIYKSHLDSVKIQLERIPYKLPKLLINKKIENLNDIENLNFNDFELIDYISHPAIKVDMVV